MKKWKVDLYVGSNCIGTYEVEAETNEQARELAWDLAECDFSADEKRIIEEGTYIVGIYDNQNNLVDTMEVEAEDETEAEEIAYDEWLQGIKDRHYASALKDDSNE